MAVRKIKNFPKLLEIGHSRYAIITIRDGECYFEGGKHNMKYKLGDVVWVDFPGRPGESHIQVGRRPAVIVQNNIGNRYSPITQVVPLTSRLGKTSLPTHVFLPAADCGLRSDSIALCENVMPVSQDDILSYITTLPEQYMKKVNIGCMINTPHLKYLSISEVLNLWRKQQEQDKKAA